jgi:hypothetical protein
MIATTLIESQLTGDDAARKQALPDLAEGRWRLDRWAWRHTVLMRRNPPEAYFSVNAFYNPSDGHPRRVRFQRRTQN